MNTSNQATELMCWDEINFTRWNPLVEVKKTAVMVDGIPMPLFAACSVAKCGVLNHVRVANVAIARMIKGL